MVLSSTQSVANTGRPGPELPPQGEHRVQRGETLGILASRYGLSVAALAEANDIVDVDLIVIGSVLGIPRAGVAPEPAHEPVGASPAAVPPAPAEANAAGPAPTDGAEGAAAATAPVPQRDAHPGVARLEALYREARFEEALAASGELVLGDRSDTGTRARLELLRGKLATAFGRAEQARDHFARARKIDPSLALPADDSPKVAALFRAARGAGTR